MGHNSKRVTRLYLISRLQANQFGRTDPRREISENLIRELERKKQKRTKRGTTGGSYANSAEVATADALLGGKGRSG